MSDPLNRFVIAQDPVFEQVLSELRAGRKQSHWMWFVFPQIAGLGRSATSRRFAITAPGEARAYLSHESLGPRLREATGAVMSHIGPDGVPLRSIGEIFGWPDKLKFHSSMTLFSHTGPNESLFKEALNAYFDGKEDCKTLDLIAALAGEKEKQP